MEFVDDKKVEEKEKDAPNVRYIHTKHGFSVKLERRDPYGLVYVVWNMGSVPIALQGAYSSFDLARADVNRYFEANTFNKVVEEPVVYDKAVYKKRYRKDEVING